MNPARLVPIVSACLALTASAQLSEPSIPAAAVSPAPATAGLEMAGVVEASTFLPAELMSGALHRVEASAYNDGLNNTYILVADGQEHEVTTELALRTRIRELYAIAHLRQMSKTEEFGKAMAAAGKQKVEGVVKIVKDPIGTASRLPKGASRFFGRVGEGLKGGRSEGEDDAVKTISGVSKAKAQLAAKLGVSPYSLNPDLQRELDSTARAMAGGGLVISAATAAVSGGAGAITALNVNETLQQTLVTKTPADLRIANRRNLIALGADAELADEFLTHPWYSPWQTTIITDALAILRVDPSGFLREACRATTPEDALYFQRLAQLLERYHATQGKIASVRVVHGVVCGQDALGTLVVPLSCDYAIWNERAAQRVEQFGAETQSGELKRLALWVDGKVSARLAQELQNRKVTLQTDALPRR